MRIEYMAWKLLVFSKRVRSSVSETNRENVKKTAVTLQCNVVIPVK